MDLRISVRMLFQWILIFGCLPLNFASISVKFSKNLKTLEEVKHAKGEIVHYIDLKNETVVDGMADEKKSSDASFYNEHLEEVEDLLFAYNSTNCPIEDWNNIRTDSIPNHSRHLDWAQRDIGRRKYLYHNSFALLAAFLFTDHITVTLTAENMYNSIHDPNIVNLHFKVQWIIKDFNTPARYENDEQLTREMLFHKYQNLSQVGSFWEQPKCIIRPEKIGIMTIHAPLTTYSGIRRSLVNESIGVVR
ncbi:hypothetical protein CAEBREN_29969 [Caenorhabditis brenneri]|uniref:Glycosyltransferase family 92 protein n=1 Tax=Caenorhabditis brenneri TaxID=135651 RepID=G0NE29_CAEBE|nr:hypothetical protein CAEBREN_29969 [Caenorhabditis brenneri]